MDQKPANPLAKHFRQPAIYLKLPSGGRYWPEDAIRLPMNGEIAIYPMTTKDEITLRTPDALINGSGVISVIESCCPEILDAWRMPSIDLDATIIAIRIASYGTEMSFNSKCPACEQINDYAIDLTQVLGRIRMPDYDTLVEADSLKIKLYPQPYFSFNSNNQAEFEEQQLLRAIEDVALDPDVRAAKIKEHSQKIITLGISTMANSTEYIEVDDTKVYDKDHLREFYSNVGSSVVKQIQKRLGAINEEGAVKPMHVNCTECQNPFDIQITFDYASFFDNGF
jgi:hypothetical protein